ncbi:uncharacterized protein LOC110254761 [Exaiptasia diaphana]|uniref:Uncharacterized protein n=1 Tax=Exaiptasia diaphana TaxID=2652724 RepID=A0A913YX61_EXADI|nr:uncharacterized protein LOC110254761 [Exaiptasia diaphana]XP_028519663.1 uncharacterized protein LOC110254761 [Exaiptasia diaphana]XP_028519664.1 uncharacterized protein LOC110254761 [Exaiptasia diaphana]
MSKFEEDFRGSFDAFSHNSPNVGPFDGTVRGNEKSPFDVMMINDVSPSVSQSSKGTKKAKMMSETNNEKGVATMAEQSSISPNKNGSESLVKEEILIPSNKTNIRLIEAVIQDEGKEAQMFLLKWKPPFTESEAFETFFPSEMDHLLKEILQVEAHLKNQKEQLRSRLTHLSQTLKIQMK